MGIFSDEKNNDEFQDIVDKYELQLNLTLSVVYTGHPHYILLGCAALNYIP